MNNAALIFDLDGTIADTLPDITLAVNRMRESFQLPALEQEVVGTYVGNGFEKLLERSLKGTGVTPAQGRDILHETFAESLNVASHLYPGVFEGLRTLRNAGYQLALLSNKPEHFCKFILTDFGIADSFRAIFGGIEECPLKPDPTGLLSILDIFGTEKQNAWMIGDSVTDLETGRRAGVHRAFVRWGYGTTGAERPEQEFDSFAGLIKFFIDQAGK